jgi:hypothetical protein
MTFQTILENFLSYGIIIDFSIFYYYIVDFKTWSNLFNILICVFMVIL